MKNFLLFVEKLYLSILLIYSVWPGSAALAVLVTHGRSDILRTFPKSVIFTQQMLFIFRYFY